MLALSLQNLRHHGLRLLGVWITLACATVLICASAVLLTTGLMSADDAGRFAEADAVVSGRISLRPEGGDFTSGVTLPETAIVPDALFDTLAAHPDVEQAIGVRSIERAARSEHGTVPVTVTDWSSVAFSGWAIPLDDQTAADRIVVTASLADELDLAIDQDLTLVEGGAEHRLIVGGIVGDTDAPLLVITPDALLTTLGAPANQYSAIALDLQASPDTHALDTLVHDASPALTIHTGDDIATIDHRDLAAGRGTLLAIAGSFGGFAVLISLFVVGILMSLSVESRRRELAVCRAIGASPAMTIRLVAGEGLLLGLIATAVGLWPGMLLAGRMSDALAERGMIPANIVSGNPTLTLIAAAAITVVLVTVAAIVGSAIAVAGLVTTSPVEALQASRAPLKTPGRWRLTAGLVVMGIGACAAVVPIVLPTEAGSAGSGSAALLMVIGIAIMAPIVVPRLLARALAPLSRQPALWLAHQNLTANPTRLASVVSPLVMAVGFTLTMVCNQAILAGAAQQQASAAIIAPVSITATVPGGISGTTLSDLAALPDVDGLVTMRTTTLRIARGVVDETEFISLATIGVTGDVTRGIDPDVRSGDLADLSGQTIAIEHALARVLRLSPGDETDVILGDGSTVRLRVVATYARGLGLSQAIVPDDVLAGHAAPPARVLVLGEPGVPAPAMTDRVRTFVDTHPGLAVADAEGLANDARAESAAAAWVNLAGLAVILIFMGIGIFNAMVLATRTRTRELALLRLVGIGRGTITGVLALEVVITAIVATIAGVAVSAIPLLAMSIGFLHRPWPTGPAWVLPGLSGGVLLVVALAVMLPALVSMRAEPVTAMGIRD